MPGTLKIKKIDSEAVVPQAAYEHDAGLDLYSVEPVRLEAGERKAVRTGIALEIPAGFAGLIWDKSSVSMKHGLKTLGGVVDAGYRGEIQVGLVNFSDKAYEIGKGDKIAQLLVQKIEHLQVVEVDELSDTERSERGFGSSGK